MPNTQHRSTMKANTKGKLRNEPSYWNNSLYSHSGAKPNVAFYGDGFVCYI